MDVFDLVAKITLDDSGFHSGLDKVKGAFGTIAGVGAKAIGAATAAVGAFTASAVKAGAGFDTSMSQVAATMGYTTEQINTAGSEASETFNKLRDFAQEMGRTTMFSASQSADALNYMALAGYDAETSIGMLPNVLNLAAAGSMDLASASDMVTDAASALGMTLEDGSVDVERVTSMIDGMAVTASKSNTSVSQLGSAILTIGGTAKQLRGGFVEMADGTKVAYDGTTELSAALGILADNGVKGSEGGTALRNVLNTFSGNKFAKTFGAMGVAVYDASGEMRSMKDILKDMNGVMEGMTTEEKTGLINSTFNARDLKNVNALLATTTDRWDQLTMSIEDSKGAAQEMANTQLDNLEGDITTFKSAWEGLQIAISDTVKGPLREFVQFGTQAIGDLTQALNEGGIEGFMEQLGTTLSEGISFIATYMPSFIEGGIKLLQALGEGMLQALPSILGSLAQIATMIIQNLGGGLIEALPVILDAASQIITMLVQGVTEHIPDLIPVITDIIVNIANFITQNLPLLLNAAIQIILAIAMGIAGALPQLVPAVADIVMSIVDTLISNVDMLIDAAIALTIGLAEGFINALPILLEKAPIIVEKFMQAIVNNAPKLLIAAAKLVITMVSGIVSNLPKVVNAGIRMIGSVVAGLMQAREKIKEAATNIVTMFGDTIKAAIANAKQWGQDLIDGFVSGIKESIGKVVEVVGGVAKKVKDNIGFSVPKEGPLHDFATYAPDMMSLFAQGIKENEDLVRNQLEKSFNFSDVLATQNVSMAGSGGSSPVGNSIVMNIYPSAGMDEKALAKEISYRLSDQEARTKVIQRDTRTKATWRLANA